MRTIWLSSLKMTVVVSVDNDEVIQTASPIVRKFIGQTLNQLVNWMGKQGGLRVEKL